MRLSDWSSDVCSSDLHPETLQGLAGLGDLIATCQSPLSRNNTAGRLLGQGVSLPDVIKQMQQTAEGLASVAPVLQLAREVGVGMPIVEQVKMVLAIGRAAWRARVGQDV